MSALTGVSVVQALADLLLASRRSLPLTEKDQQEGSGDVGKP